MGILLSPVHVAGVVGFLTFLPLIALFVVPALVRWLWNLTLPQLFGWSRIEYWQAFRLFVLAAVLFGLPRLV